MFKNLLLLCLAVSAIQAVPTYTYNEETDVDAEAVIGILQRILEALERLDLPVIGDVNLGAPLIKIKEAIEGVLAAAHEIESLSCLLDAIKETGVETVSKIVDEFENLLALLEKRQYELAVCNELPIVRRQACRARVQATTGVRVAIAVAKVTNAVNDIPTELLKKIIGCIFALLPF